MEHIGQPFARDSLHAIALQPQEGFPEALRSGQFRPPISLSKICRQMPVPFSFNEGRSGQFRKRSIARNRTMTLRPPCFQASLACCGSRRGGETGDISSVPAESWMALGSALELSVRLALAERRPRPIATASSLRRSE